jgi:hypothetical protein
VTITIKPITSIIIVSSKITAFVEIGTRAKNFSFGAQYNDPTIINFVQRKNLVRHRTKQFDGHMIIGWA